MGGAFVAWADKRSNANGDIYVQHVWFQGSNLWTPNGIQVSTGSTAHVNPQIVSDNVGGGIITWGDGRAGYTRPVAQRVGSGGGMLWTVGGVLLSSGNAATASQISVAPDGLGGAIVGFIDGRAGIVASNYDLFASHLDSWGILGAEPAIAGVKDVPNDNGGHVKVSWYASPLEADPGSVGVTDYLVFRSAPPNVAAQVVAAGRVTQSPDVVTRADASSRPLLALPDGVNTYFWELVATQSAYHLPTYSVVAPTTGDSMGIGNPKTAFMIEAHNWSNNDYWMSAPDSGYSTDNVPPIVPAPFMGTYSAGTASLHWGANPETDLANYRLYRGMTAAFVAGPGSLVAAPVDTGYVDHAGTGYYYKLTAVDIHGNESPAASLLPSGTLGVGGPAAPRGLALAAPSPNPASGSTRIAFELPRATHVRLTVFDAGGAARDPALFCFTGLADSSILKPVHRGPCVAFRSTRRPCVPSISERTRHERTCP